MRAVSRNIGAVRITRIEEGIFDEPVTLFPDWRAEVLAEHPWMVPHCFNAGAGCFRASIHSWLVQTPHHNILVDTCGGNHKERPLSPRFHHLETDFLGRLYAAGVVPEEIDFVLCTHLHIDHVGWNTRLQDGRWVPTFPNAKYLFSRAEHARWDPAGGVAAAGAHPIYQDSVLPVIAANQYQFVDGDDELEEGLSIVSAPGHTPGQCNLRLVSQGVEALFCGDVMHQPIQVYYPHWNSRFCDDQEQARATRRRVLEHCVEHRSLLLPGHFGAPHAGHVKHRSGGFSFSFDGVA